MTETSSPPLPSLKRGRSDNTPDNIPSVIVVPVPGTGSPELPEPNSQVSEYDEPLLQPSPPNIPRNFPDDFSVGSASSNRTDISVFSQENQPKLAKLLNILDSISMNANTTVTMIQDALFPGGITVPALKLTLYANPDNRVQMLYECTQQIVFILSFIREFLIRKNVNPTVALHVVTTLPTFIFNFNPRIVGAAVYATSDIFGNVLEVSSTMAIYTLKTIYENAPILSTAVVATGVTMAGNKKHMDQVIEKCSDVIDTLVKNINNEANNIACQAFGSANNTMELLGPVIQYTVECADYIVIPVMQAVHRMQAVGDIMQVVGNRMQVVGELFNTLIPTATLIGHFKNVDDDATIESQSSKSTKSTISTISTIETIATETKQKMDEILKDILHKASTTGVSTRGDRLSLEPSMETTDGDNGPIKKK